MSFAAQRFCWDCWQGGARPAVDDYGEYLASRDWRLQRAYRLELAGERCEQCVTADGLQAHHLTYDRRGHELLEDLEVLCRACHEQEHGIQPKERPMSASRASFAAAIAGSGDRTITIRALTIDDQAMTVAAYRQLPTRPLVSWKDGSLHGEPWGWLNLCPSRDCPSGEHRHVLWEADGNLYRDACRPPGAFESWSDWSDTWATLAAADTSRRHITWNRDGSQPFCHVVFVEGLPPVACRVPHTGDFTMVQDIDETAGKAEPPPCTCAPYREGDKVYHRDCGVSWREAQTRLEQRAADVAKEAGGHTLEEIADFIKEELREAHAAHLAGRARWQEICSLTQLFLGVWA